ncbi:short-chain dehydrogenase/reductase SDR [Lentithecium fluviatile CBS 122367]|uniref:Short-chain dehydrogenase/reductase SDR n=1 Tax=Lentithecium fluviatile CBS 122367 TaxID=1168545 RepID=A0A6G1IVF5_9PLEO|nr:short-chain dehydrogenase/reductase SDR [Lentithecium fluviatile CBS 122367]
MGGILGFCYRQLTYKPKPLPSSVSLSGKTALVTGSNSGLGLEASRELVAYGLSRLILAVRDVSKGEAAKKSISETSPKCDIEVWSLDHDSYESIVAFGKRMDTLDRLDFALLNAGVKKMEYSTSRAGHELNVQINHVGTSAVSLLVLPALKKTAEITKSPSRMTIVSSEGHFWIPFKEQSAPNILECMDDKATFGNAMQRYYTTKLLNIFWTRELATKVLSDRVIINAVNPGFCYSGLHRHENTGIIKMFLWMFGWSSIQGGHCLTDALVQHENSHGEYFSEQRQTPPSAFVRSPRGQEAQKKVWEETLALLKKEVPGIDTPIVE